MSDSVARQCVGVVRETAPGETRVALTPAVVPELEKSGFSVVVETGAGVAAGYSDAAYTERGAKIVSDRASVLAKAQIVACVRAAGGNPAWSAADAAGLTPGQTVIALCDPLGQAEVAAKLAAGGIQLFSLELLPRITRAQSMDVLSSMALVAGYKAVLLAANALPRMFPMFMTAAGTVQPARVFVVGAGVAGLQAIATACRLGAVVTAYDVRPTVKEEVKSVGGRFLELPLDTQGAEGAGGYARSMDESFYRRQQELMGQAVATSDVVITTAVIPGKPAPRLVSRAMVEEMPAGSVLVDLAAERGGNCEATVPGETVTVGKATILGPTNLPALVPYHSSQLYSKNIAAFIKHLFAKGPSALNLSDEIVRETLVARGGEVVHPRVREKLGASMIMTLDLGGS